MESEYVEQKKGPPSRRAAAPGEAKKNGRSEES
jgi:hypothetical protein